MMKLKMILLFGLVVPTLAWSASQKNPLLPYDGPRMERENIFAFTEKPQARYLGDDKYEISFSVKGKCDVTVSLVDQKGVVVRHLASGVLGRNAPAPFQKDALKQTIIWNGKNDLGKYVKKSKELRVNVQLGLKPVFDKRLGGTSPYNLPGNVMGMVAGPNGVHVFIRKRFIGYLRTFDHEGGYVHSMVPPAGDTPEEKMDGLGFVEYAPGKRAVHSTLSFGSLCDRGNYLPGVTDVINMQPALTNGKVYYLNGAYKGPVESKLFSIDTDGSTTRQGLEGQVFFGTKRQHIYSRLAASPDGKWIYMVGARGSNALYRFEIDANKKPEMFLGDIKPGRDNKHFNEPKYVDVDAQGRLYVADYLNKRIQIFSPDGAFLKSISVDRPHTICVHKKTGAIYIQHLARIGGRTVNRLTKFHSFKNPKEIFHKNGISTGLMIIDSWAPKPRLWMASNNNKGVTMSGMYGAKRPGLTIMEDTGKDLKTIVDFAILASEEAGKNYMGRWSGSIYDHVSCDAVREELYYQHWRDAAKVFDLKTGKLTRVVGFSGKMNDIDFDKKGYLHAHLDAGYNRPGVGRLDPQQRYKKSFVGRPPQLRMKEIPYDYGIGEPGWVGLLAVKDQPGAKYFQDGFGVNMKGEMAVQSNIWYAPKLGGAAFKHMNMGHESSRGRGSSENQHGEYKRRIQEQQKKGAVLYSVPKFPGLPVSGATVWVFESSGELRAEAGVIAAHSMAGVQIDEAGFIYFSQTSTKLVNGKPFLKGQGGNFGGKPTPGGGGGMPGNLNPRTGIYAKTRGQKVRFLQKNSHILMDTLPSQPPVITGYRAFKGPAWIEGLEWLYSGVSPIYVKSGCSCASSRPHLDWYKRSFIPESYRHAIGILDSNGNVIAHVGRFGNFDDAAKMKQGSENITLTLPRFISTTDGYLVFDDFGERLVVAKLAYHVEAAAKVIVGK